MWIYFYLWFGHRSHYVSIGYLFKLTPHFFQKKKAANTKKNQFEPKISDTSIKSIICIRCEKSKISKKKNDIFRNTDVSFSMKLYITNIQQFLTQI